MPTSRVPDKPTLDGLEDAVGRRYGRSEGTYRVRPRRATREQVFSIDTPPPTVSGSAARRARVLLHPHRLRRPLPAHAGQGGLLPDGLGRQRPAHRAAGAELLRRPLRPVAAVRPGLRAARQAGRQEAGADQPAELHRAVRAAGRARTSRSSRRCGAALGLSVDWTRPTRRSATTRARQPARVPAQPGARRGLPAGGPDAVGRDVPDRRRAGRARGPRATRAPTTASRSTVDATARSRSRPPGPS